MKRNNLVLFALLFLQLMVASAVAQTNVPAAPDGWKLSSQAYTFRLFTFEETLKKLKSIGVTNVEVFPGQKIAAGSEATTTFTAGEEDRKKIKELLATHGIQAVCYGVVGGRNEDEWRKIFEFAKYLGIGIVNSEPSFGQLDMLEKLCKEYQIKVAFHNHPVPSIYWHPKVVLNALNGRNEWLGACADIGHWVRSGLNPIDCLKELEGRVFSFHLKDLHQFGNKDAHDVPWGTGNSNIAGVLNEMKRQNFKGVFSVEYEYKWENNLPEVKESVEYFRRVAAQIVQ